MSRTKEQQMGDSHEASIAEWIVGSQTKGSGNQWHNQGDAKNNEREIPFPITADGKSTLGKSIAVSRSMWEKIVEQTFGQIPTLWLRFYRDESLRVVDHDLVTLRARDFQEILEAARNWEAIREEIGHEGVLEAADVIKIMNGDDGGSAGAAIAELRTLNPSGNFRVMECSSGCDCCR